MIMVLTEAQKPKLKEYRDKWVKIGFATGEMNVKKALSWLRVAYKEAKLDPPTKYEIYDSPIAAIHEMKLRYNLDIKTRDFIYGTHDAAWMSYYNFLDEVINTKACKRFSALVEFSKIAGWALLFDDLIVLTRLPVIIKLDKNGLLHNEEDYAIKYRDGFGIASWHGTTIPEEWILNKSSITKSVLFEWENIEQRRCACEIIGWANVLTYLNAIVIDEDVDPTIGTLFEVELPDSGKEKFLLAVDPNRKEKVGIPVPKEMQSALEANSWTYGIDTINFKPEFRV